MLNFFKTKYLILIGSLIGAIIGYWYYAKIGCVSGTCPITSKPFNSTFYGAFLGGILFSNFIKSKK